MIDIGNRLYSDLVHPATMRVYSIIEACKKKTSASDMVTVIG